MKRFYIAILVLCAARYSGCTEQRSFVLWHDPQETAWKVHLFADYDKKLKKTNYMGYDKDSKQDLLKDLKNKDKNFKPNPTPFIETNTTKGWTARFFVIESFDDPSWKKFFYTLDTIKNKTFPKTPDTIEPLTLEMLTKLNIDDVIKFFKTSVQSGTGKSGGEKLSGIKLEAFTGNADCKSISITHKWPEAETAGCIHFYAKDKPYYCFANTFRNFAQDPLLKGKKPAIAYVKVASIDNFDWLPTTIDGVEWITTEHYFHAQKFKKPEAAYKQMKKLTTGMGALPGEVKKFTLPNWFNNDWKQWDAQSGLVMLKAIRAKFSQHPELNKILLGTYPKMIVEDTAQASYVENIWGAGKNYTGCNQLGQVLMHVRQELHDGTYYIFNKGDAKYYFDLLSGNTAWKQDQNPDKTLIPDGYDQLLKTVKKQETSEALPPDTAVMHLAERLKLLA